MSRSKRRSNPTVLCSALVLTVLCFALPAGLHAQCVPYLAYVDLFGGFIEDPSHGLDVVQFRAIPPGALAEGCSDDGWRAAVVEVTVPQDCERAVVWVEYQGEPHGWTLNVGDSISNNGFGGDAGTVPMGQNAELGVLDQTFSVWSAADNPDDVDRLATSTLALRDGALKVVVSDQELQWGQPHVLMQTPDLERLFFLPDGPVEPDNRTFYVGLNRVVSLSEPLPPLDAPVPTRTGCGARRALITFE